MFRKVSVLVVAFLSFAVLAAPSAFAERALMIFKTNVPLEIPGIVLNPGTYTLVNMNSIDLNGPIGIQNSRGKIIGQYLMQPVRRANASSKSVLEVQKQADAPARIKELIPGSGAFGYQFMYSHPPVRPDGVAFAKDLPLSQLESSNG